MEWGSILVDEETGLNEDIVRASYLKFIRRELTNPYYRSLLRLTEEDTERRGVDLIEEVKPDFSVIFEDEMNERITVIIQLLNQAKVSTAKSLKILLALSMKGFAAELQNAKKQYKLLTFIKFSKLNDAELFLEFYLSNKKKLLQNTIRGMLNGTLEEPVDTTMIIEKTSDYCLFGKRVEDPVYFKSGKNFYCYDRLSMLRIISYGKTETPEGWEIPDSFVSTMKERYPVETKPRGYDILEVNYSTFDPFSLTVDTLGEWHLNQRSYGTWDDYPSKRRRDIEASLGL